MKCTLNRLIKKKRRKRKVEKKRKNGSRIDMKKVEIGDEIDDRK